jgi:hypothetical protein
LELSLCQRYYDTNYPVGTAPGTALNFPGAIGIKDPSTTTEFENTCPFHVTMRAAPSVTLYRPGDGVINTVEEFGSGSKTVTSITANRITTSGFTSVVISGGSAGAKVYFYMYTASAEL